MYLLFINSDALHILKYHDQDVLQCHAVMLLLFNAIRAI